MTIISVIGGVAAASSFLPGTYFVDTLPEASSDNVGKYATVMDLYGEKRDVVLCSSVGLEYFWQPTRPTYAKSVAAVADMTLTALKSPSVIYLTGGIAAGVTRNVNLSTNLVFPGAAFEIAFDGTLGLGSLLNIAGLVSGPLGVLVGGRRRVFWDGSIASGAWKSF